MSKHVKVVREREIRCYFEVKVAIPIIINTDNLLIKCTNTMIMLCEIDSRCMFYVRIATYNFKISVYELMSF